MPYLGLIYNAFVWGVSWWPLRHLQALGLHPLWATSLFFVLGAVLVSLWRPDVPRLLARHPALWALALAAGGTNAAFNWAVSEGDVVRVVLLFYMMPLWAVLLAWWLLDERITRAALLRVALALGGAMLVLKPEGSAWPRFGGLADWLGLMGGFGFALNNVLLRQQAGLPAAARALAMFAGGALFPVVLGLVLIHHGMIPALPAPAPAWMLGTLAMGLVFLSSNLALQYGAAALPVHVTSVVMLTEVVFAAATSVWLGGAAPTPTILAGGALILAAALMSARDRA